MSENIDIDEVDPIIDGLKQSQWRAILKTLSADPGWLATAALLSADVADANNTIFNSPEPERQIARCEAIGFVKFANRLTEIRDRARFISERGVSPDAASRNAPL